MDVVADPRGGHDDDEASADELADDLATDATGTSGPTVPASSATMAEAAASSAGAGSTGGAATALDLSPRRTTDQPVIHGRRPGGRTRKWPWAVVLVLIVVAIGFVVSRAIGDATLFFYNADEAVTKQAELGDRQFRLQGTVVPGSTARTADGVTFLVGFNGVDVRVNHVGDPPDLFQDQIPVVLEGHWVGTGASATFASDRILVKHSENYDAKNPERLKEATQGGATATTVTPAVPTTAAPVTP